MSRKKPKWLCMKCGKYFYGWDEPREHEIGGSCFGSYKPKNKKFKWLLVDAKDFSYVFNHEEKKNE